MLFIIFHQVLAKGRVQVGKITSNNTPEGISSDCDILCAVKSE